MSATLITVEDGGHGRGFGPTVQKIVETFLAHHLLGEETKVEDQTIAAGQ